MSLYKIERLLRSRQESPAIYRPNDVILASFPKSGNTWFRFLLSNVTAALDGFDFGEVGFHSLDYYSPEIRGNRYLKGATSTKYPTFLKTHFPYVDGFKKYPAVLLYRDPVKVLMSYKTYLEEEHSHPHKSVDDFIKHWRYGAPAWCLFHEYWLESKSNVIFIKYEDALVSTSRILTEIYSSLGCSIEFDIFDAAVRASTRDEMNKVLKSKGDPKAKNNNYEFVRTENSKERSVLNEQQTKYVVDSCSDVYARLEERRLKL